ncbi:UbiD family decarboxylase [Dissulfurirhabdus thermomarina]|nr:UbiD family decarboxylase [Dissulfurirhabdus thermomarina]
MELRDFLSALEVEGELVRIPDRVSPRLEIGEVTRRVAAAGGPALLFERPGDFDIPVATNLFGTARRMAAALGVSDLGDLGDRFLRFLDLDPAARRSLVTEVDEAAAPCREVVRDGRAADLGELPVPLAWPGDGGPFLTLPVVLTRHPETGEVNAGMYRVQVFDARTAGLGCHPASGAAAHVRAAEAGGRPLDVAVALGPATALTYAATVPLPPGLDELSLAGFLQGAPVAVVPGRTVDVAVPAGAEIVVEGRIQPGERRPVGPAGNHTGRYAPAVSAPVIRVTAVTRRDRAVLPATQVGPPPQEDRWFVRATERLFLPWWRRRYPGLLDVHLPEEGLFGHIALVRVARGHGRDVLRSLFSAPFLGGFKLIAAFDEEVDLRDPSQVLWRLGADLDPERDLVVPDPDLDPAPSLPHYGGRLGLDATRGAARPMRPDPAAARRAAALCRRLELAGR